MIGMTLSGRYIVRAVVGTGGMSVVYRAWDKKLNREVAIKVLRPEYVKDQEFVRRFDNEALAASKMSHPNIVGVYGVGQQSNVRYIIMEYVEGRTLKDLIRQTGHIAAPGAIQMLLRILAAVDHAHRNHIVHRDIKPQNILVDQQGNVKVADFGIARTTNATMTIADEGSMLGSVHYLSPEQASGKVADEKSDLYSVGVVLYEMLTGSVPFDGETAVSIAIKHVEETPRSPQLLEPEVSKGLEEVIMKALEKNPAARYQTAADMANDLKRALRMPEGGFVEVYHPVEDGAPDGRAQRKQRFRRRLKIISAVAVVILLGVGGFVLARLYEDIFVKIKTPNVTLLDIEEAVRVLNEAGVIHGIEKEKHNDISIGYVITQDPKPGELMWPGDKVDIIVSDGKPLVEMPDFTGVAKRQAEDAIKENGFVVAGSQFQVSTRNPGEVIGQSPAAGELVQAGSGVTLYISGESAPVPSLTGFTVDEARALLVSKGFKLGTVTERLSDKPYGTVIAQGVSWGDMALLGGEISITISQVQEETYRAQEVLKVTVPKSGGIVLCILDEGEFGQREVFSSEFPGGEQSIPISIDTPIKGVHTVRVYVNDVVQLEREIEFK